jgi:soluble lytic murein transglycosylase-like protein
MDGIKPQISAQEALLQKSVEEVKKNIKNPEKLDAASQEFESLFVYFMLKNMRKTVIKSGLFAEGYGEEIMQGLFDQEISKKIAQHSQLGIAELLVNQLDSSKKDNLLKEQIFRALPRRSKNVYINNLNIYQNSNAQDKLKRFDKYINDASFRTGVNTDLIRAVIMTESSGNPNAVSSKRAKGLMQIMDSTAVEVGIKNVFHPKEKMLKTFNGNLKLALAAYNAGPTAVKKYKGIPPYKETQNYVKKVLNFYHQYLQQNKSNKTL